MQRNNGLWSIYLALLIVLLSAQITLATTNPTDPNTNHTVMRDDSAIFTVDGLNTAGTQYSSDEKLELGGSLHMEAKVYMKRYRSGTGDEELRIYFSVHDTTNDSDDVIEFVFDRLHNHGSGSAYAASEDVMLRIRRSNCSPSCSVERIQRSGGLFSAGSMVTISNAQVIIDNVGEYSTADTGLQSGWVGELVLTPSDLGWGYFPQVIGVLITAQSDGANAITNANGLGGAPAPRASYPYNHSCTPATSSDCTLNNVNAADWGNLKLRYPIKYAVILDNSGSMLSLDGGTESRWTRAKRAADLFATTLGLFKDPHGMFDDEISVAQYSWSCNGNNSSGDTTGAVQGISAGTSMVDVPNPPTGTNSLTSSNSVDPAGNNCTPIRRGVTFALQGQLDFIDPVPASRVKEDRIAILLSDGLHNMPPAHVPYNPSTDHTAAEKAFSQMRTVSIGPDGIADTSLLGNISTAFNGGVAYTYEAKFNQTNAFDDLLRAYLETVQAPLAINQVEKVGVFYNAGAPNKLVFIGAWNDASQASQLVVKRNGTTMTPVNHYENTHIGYAASVYIDPDSPGDNLTGNWQIDGAGSGPAPDNEFVLADLRILARFLVEQKPYNAGDPILLEVNLKDMANPVLGADVSVEVAKPGEGLGNYLSTVQENCSMQYPQLPSDEEDDIKLPCYRLAKLPGCLPIGLTTQKTVLAATATTTGNDPVPGRYALADYHFKRCEKDGLDQDKLPGIKLYDDGTHGDSIANDGIYSLSFNNTDLEGSYTFRFHVRGTTSDGLKFSRTRMLSQFVGIQPDEEASEVTSLSGSVSGGWLTMYVYFLPRDRLGNYVGPGFAHKYKVNIEGGMLAGGLQDLNNGSYMQQVRYREGDSKPTVTFTDKEDCFEKTADLGKRAYELVPFVGMTFFDGALDLNDGVVHGIRFNTALRKWLLVGVELGFTPTETASGDSGNVIQALVNARYDLQALRAGRWLPYVTAGTGYVFFRGFGMDDEAPVVHGGAGSTFELGNSFGIRVDGRVFQIGSVMNAGATTNLQVTGGLVFRF